MSTFVPFAKLKPFIPTMPGEIHKEKPFSTSYIATLVSGYRKKLFSLLQEHSYKEGDFILASGQQSDYFLDIKQTMLKAEGHRLLGLGIMDIIATEINHPLYRKGLPHIRAVAGVALGGCPLASAVATLSVKYMQRPFIDALYIRKEVKDHGTQNLIEGSVEAGSNVVLLEDVLTTGASSLQALKTLRQASYNPVGLITVVDRFEDEGEQFLADLSANQFELPVFSLFSISEFHLTSKE